MNKQKEGISDEVTNISEIQMKCRHCNLLIQKKQMSAMVLGLTLCAASQYQAMTNNTYKIKLKNGKQYTKFQR